ncbi:RNA-binding protein [Candidatus Gribaldobacteria bacterium]|nr:RNA-binding protein [Candidatus Gribaldobacteria bacterium]
MNKKLFVGNLPFQATEDSLRDIFSGIGNVESVAIITDRATGRSKGFGFVEMSTEAEAKRAIEELDGKEFEGRKMFVSEAKPMQPRN